MILHYIMLYYAILYYIIPLSNHITICRRVHISALRASNCWECEGWVASLPRPAEHSSTGN